MTWLIRSRVSLWPDSTDHVAQCDLIQQITWLSVTLFSRTRVSLWLYSTDHVSQCDLIHQIMCLLYLPILIFVCHFSLSSIHPAPFSSLSFHLFYFFIFLNIISHPLFLFLCLLSCCSFYPSVIIYSLYFHVFRSAIVFLSSLTYRLTCLYFLVWYCLSMISPILCLSCILFWYCFLPSTLSYFLSFHVFCSAIVSKLSLIYSLTSIVYPWSLSILCLSCILFWYCFLPSTLSYFIVFLCLLFCYRF